MRELRFKVFHFYMYYFIKLAVVKIKTWDWNLAPTTNNTPKPAAPLKQYETASETNPIYVNVKQPTIKKCNQFQSTTQQAAHLLFKIVTFLI